MRDAKGGNIMAGSRTIEKNIWSSGNDYLGGLLMGSVICIDQNNSIKYM
jgi:energy-converting hydrogenase Eha subunit B